MHDALSCVTDTELMAYVADRSEGNRAAVVEAHLAGCRACLDRYVEMNRKSIVPDVPDCHIIAEIGRGRFGIVYKAFWTRGDTTQIVALKVLSNLGSMEETRFEREISVLKRLCTPGIVRCLASGSTESIRYYIMDFVRGHHLDEYLAASAVTLDEKLTVFERVCRAVASAHEHGVVHRDLKPRNILVDDDGAPHVLDFGICALTETDWSSWARMTLTQPGDVVGTLKYMSPEQAWGGVVGQVDTRTDIWSLGVMLHEIVTQGKFPYSLAPTRDKPAPEALLERIRKEAPKLPRLDHVPCGKALETILARCLSWDRRQRISSATLLADDLVRIVRRQRIKIRPLSLTHRASRLAIGMATTARWAFSVTFIAAVGIALWVTAFAGNVGWHVVGRQYQASRAAAPGTGILPPSRTSSRPSSRDLILVVGVEDGTGDKVVRIARNARIAQKAGIPGVTKDVRTWRAVHGYLMGRLAEVRPKALVWDYFFRSTQPGDEDFIAGLSKLEAAGTPVVLAVERYDADGRPQLSETITSHTGSPLRYGSIHARDMVHRPGDIVLGTRHKDREALPGIGLTTLAAILHPEARLELEWEGRRRSMTLLYRLGSGSYLRERDRVKLNSVHSRPKGAVGGGAESVVGWAKFEIMRPQFWRDRTVPYERLLTASTEELHRLVHDRIVVVGDLRTSATIPQPDRHPVRFGTEIVSDVPGCYLLADGIAGLLDRRYVVSSRFLAPWTLAAMMAIAGVGCLLPMKLALNRPLHSRRGRITLWALLGVVSTASLVAIVITRDFATIHACMAAFSLSTAMAGAFWVEFARNHHRILDARWRAATGIERHVKAHATSGPQQRRWLPAAR